MIWDRGLTNQLPVAETTDEKMLPVVMTIGDASHWVEGANLVDAEHRIIYLNFTEVTPEIVMAVGPTMVMSPLLSNSFDCIDLACVLQEAGFRGKYRALTRSIPNPRLVRREIKEICPEIDFDLVFVEGMDLPHAYA